MYLTTVALVSFLLAPPDSEPAQLGDVPRNLPSLGHANAPPNGRPARLSPFPSPTWGASGMSWHPKRKPPPACRR